MSEQPTSKERLEILRELKLTRGWRLFVEAMESRKLVAQGVVENGTDSTTILKASGEMRAYRMALEWLDGSEKACNNDVNMAKKPGDNR